MTFSRLITLLVLGFALCGCAREAIYADHEHGMASRDAFDQMIVNKDYRYAGKQVEGMDGLYSEHVMSKYLGTYTQGFTKEAVDISQTGVEGGE